jgi:outer membrane biosynthesis protein TonB
MRNSEQNSKLRRYVKISLGIHGGILLLLIAGKFLGFDKAEMFQPSVQIDMVALPDLVKSQEARPLDPTLPVKDAPPPPPKEEVMAKPEPKPEPKPRPDEMALEKAKEKKAENDAKKALERLKAERQKEQRAEDKRREELVNKREEDLKRFEEAYRSAIKGNQTNQGTSSTGSLQETVNAYAGHIRERLHGNWALPVWLQDKGLRAVVRMYIDGRGNIVRYQFTAVSGNDAFDNYVKGTVQRSSPFAPPPEEMAKGLRNSGLEVQFPL